MYALRTKRLTYLAVGPGDGIRIALGDLLRLSAHGYQTIEEQSPIVRNTASSKNTQKVRCGKRFCSEDGA